MKPIVYECEICGAFHPWEWDGDCRDNANRFGSPEDFAFKYRFRSEEIEVRSMDERVEDDSNE